MEEVLEIVPLLVSLAFFLKKEKPEIVIGIVQQYHFP